MQLQQLLSRTRKAIDDYNMIRDGDSIAVGISGGKDSLTLLYALAERKKTPAACVRNCARALSTMLPKNSDVIRQHTHITVTMSLRHFSCH